MTKKTVLVTGGAGFVGSHLCKSLLERKNHVICMDNFFTGRMQNIEMLKQNADKVLSLTGSKSKIWFKPLPGDDPKQRKSDIRLAGKLFGWKPEIPLKEGLKRNIEYFSNFA